MISIASQDVRGLPVVYIGGEFEARDTEVFRRYIFDLVDQLTDNRLIIDVAHLENAKSGALRVLVLVQRRLNMLGGSLVVTGAHGRVREILRLSQVDDLLDLHPCARAAASRMSGSGV